MELGKFDDLAAIILAAGQELACVLNAKGFA